MGLKDLYRRLPQPAQRLYRACATAPSVLSWRFSRAGHWHAGRIAGPLRGRYEGETCVIMGNGPSLKTTNWALLKGVHTFGLNRIYLLFQEMGFMPEFYCCVNQLVLRQFADDIRGIPSLKFLDWRGGRPFFPTPDDRTVLIPSIASGRFHGDILEGWNPGCTVTFAALQVAYFLGFSRVVLIGVDHSFVTKGTAHSRVTSNGDDPNHFAANYFGRGVTWQLPDLDGSETAYQLARQEFESAGRRVIDATAGGRLRVFPKMPLEEALAADG